MGADLTIQNDFPSMLTDGKAKRAVIAVRTKAARAMFKKENRFCRYTVLIGDLSRGSTEKL